MASDYEHAKKDARIRIGRRLVIGLAQIEVGAKMSIDGQIFELIGRHPFARLDGTIGEILNWRAPCAVCGKPFVTSSPSSGSTPTRRCREHRSAGKAVAGNHKAMTVKWLLPEEKAGAS